MQRLPLQHFLPSLLVVGVVYLDDVVHILRGNIVLFPAPAFTKHRIPEHLLAGIHPELLLAVGGGLRNRRYLSLGRQRERLSR
uniref:Putative secreted protein n=1 Tax=Anopheles triannulatus TaxID=58253 RepID=A0A2M4B7F0_9DIPT